MATQPKLVLIDGSALIYRAFFAIPGNFTTSSGLHTNAIFGFATTFKKLFAGRKPTLGAVIFDAPGKTFRDEQYPAYKSHRPKMPAELREQLPHIDRVVETHRFPLLRVPGYEADDVIGTLAREGREAGMEVVIVSGDKDFAQLIDDNVRMIDPFRDIVYDAELVRKKWGVAPALFVDYLALVGDKADNIPGVPGIGAKSAASLLEAYGSLEGLYGHLDELKGKQRTNLEENAEAARLSKALATIDTHVPLERRADELVLDLPDKETLNALYRELEFFSLLDHDAVDRAFEADTLDVELLAEPGALRAYLLEDAGLAETAVHPVFDGVSPANGETVGFAFSRAHGRAAYVPIPADGDARAALLEVLGAYFADAGRPKLAHGARELDGAARRAGLALTGVVFDTQLASFLVDPTGNIPHRLSQVVKAYLHRAVRPEKQVRGSGKDERRFRDVPALEVASYAGHLAEATYCLREPLDARLTEEGQRENHDVVDLPLAAVLADMEEAGILVDREELARIGEELREKLEGLERGIHDAAGRVFNIGSTKQLATVLFEELGLPVQKRTKSGYSTNAEVLERLVDKHPIAELLLEHRKLAKLINTYTDVLQEAVNPRTGRVHTSIQQTVGATGRLITTDPDLQRTPVKTPEGRRIREAFIAPEGTQILSADWSQIELRILAHVSEDPLLIEAFQKDLDVHRRTASQIFGVAPEAVTAEQRGIGKTINFATIYGQGATALGQQLKIPRKDAQRYIESYFKAYAGVRRWLDDTMGEAGGTGYVTTLLGRRRYIPELSSNAFMERQAGERIAANTPIQGSAADICKLAMLRIAREARALGLGARMLLQIHDELVFEVPNGEADALAGLVKNAMESVVPLRVPLVASVGIGRSWGEAH